MNSVMSLTTKQSPVGPQETISSHVLSSSILFFREKKRSATDKRNICVQKAYLYSFLTKSLVGGMPESASREESAKEGGGGGFLSCGGVVSESLRWWR